MDQRKDHLESLWVCLGLGQSYLVIIFDVFDFDFFGLFRVVLGRKFQQNVPFSRILWKLQGFWKSQWFHHFRLMRTWRGWGLWWTGPFPTSGFYTAYHHQPSPSNTTTTHNLKNILMGVVPGAAVSVTKRKKGLILTLFSGCTCSCRKSLGLTLMWMGRAFYLAVAFWSSAVRGSRQLWVNSWSLDICFEKYPYPTPSLQLLWPWSWPTPHLFPPKQAFAWQLCQRKEVTIAQGGHMVQKKTSGFLSPPTDSSGTPLRTPWKKSFSKKSHKGPIFFHSEDWRQKIRRKGNKLGCTEGCRVKITQFHQLLPFGGGQRWSITQTLLPNSDNDQNPIEILRDDAQASCTKLLPEV